MTVFLKIAVSIALLALAGCSTYLEVTDTTSGAVYFTKDVDRSRSGAVEFVDANSNARISLQRCEVREIDRATFKANVR